MELQELETIIAAAGGKSIALEYAPALLRKIVALEETGEYDALLRQLRAARQEGDFRGRVLEVNFAHQALNQQVSLSYGVSQGMTGDIDFSWTIAEYRLYIETKLLGRDRGSKKALNPDVHASGVMHVAFNDISDVGRLQRDIIQKATTRKFNPAVPAGCINLVAVDVGELQLGMMDLADCLLAVGGNSLVARYYHAVHCRDDVVGVFERPEARSLTDEQQTWVTSILGVPAGNPHPRDYIHGALLLYREPSETAALSYKLHAVIIWNAALVGESTARGITPEVYRIFPQRRDGL